MNGWTQSSPAQWTVGAAYARLRRSCTRRIYTYTVDGRRRKATRRAGVTTEMRNGYR